MVRTVEDRIDRCTLDAQVFEESHKHLLRDLPSDLAAGNLSSVQGSVSRDPGRLGLHVPQVPEVVSGLPAHEVADVFVAESHFRARFACRFSGSLLAVEAQS